MHGHAWDAGPAARELVVRNRLTESVRFLGPVDDVASLMQTADVAIQPSHFEALGLSAIEALACGAPVVASAVGGLLDFVRDGENGLTCPPRDAGALAAALGRVIEDRAMRARLASVARASVEHVYDERVVFERFAQLVRALAGSRT
jgi:glycogen(starch) synthase